MQEAHPRYMQRALQLARKGAGYTAPNPMVGAVLVYKNKIIGEGYHQQYGCAHAEVNAIKSVASENKSFIKKATLYVTLEPCSHQGKTPPCTDLILSNDIPRVVLGAIDPNPSVSGSGIDQLRDAGIEVITGIMGKECAILNKRFFTYQEKKRPYLILKWAESADGFIALSGPQPVKISHSLTDRVVHRWRSEEQAILIGSRTAQIDNPQLNNRLWSGKSPVRIILNTEKLLPDYLKIFNDKQPTIVYNSFVSKKKGAVEWVQLAPGTPFLEGVMRDLFQRHFLSVLIEGGATILESFLKNNLWDEARVVTGNLDLKTGLPAPKRPAHLVDSFSIGTDIVRRFVNDV